MIVVFEKFKRFLGTIFILWLFLNTARKFGFGFGINLKIFLNVFFWFFLAYLIWETKIRWPVIYPIIKTFLLKKKDGFASEIQAKKKEVISSSPKFFAGKAGNPLVLILVIIFSFFSFFRQSFKISIRFFLQSGNLLIFAILGIFAYIFVFDFTSFLMVLLLSVLLMLVIRLNHIKGEVVVMEGLILLSLCPFLSAFKSRPLMIEKLAVWTYVFLVIGTGCMFIGYLKNED